MVLMLGESDVERLLDMGSAITVVEEVLKQQAEGRATNRPRQRVALPTGQLNFMAAGVPESRALGLKAYTAFPSGYRFYCMLFDSETGELLALIQADRLGQMRTGAASAVATRHLAREDATTLGIYGTGCRPRANWRRYTPSGPWSEPWSTAERRTREPALLRR